MKNKPWPIVILAFLYFVAPLYNLFYFSSLFDLTPWQYLHTFPSMFALIQFWIFFPIAGFAILSIRRWSYLIFVMVAAWNFYRNYQTWTHSGSQFNLSLYMLAEITNIAVVSYFLIPAVRKVYFHPKLRWWEIAPRYDIEIEAMINGIPAKIHNLAIGGVFLSRADCQKLEIGTQLELSFKYGTESYLVACQVVHYNPSYLDGYGVRFSKMSSQKFRILKKLIKKLDRSEIPKRKPLFIIEESVLNWLVNLIRTGHGILPYIPEKLTSRQSQRIAPNKPNTL